MSLLNGDHEVDAVRLPSLRKMLLRSAIYCSIWGKRAFYEYINVTYALEVSGT